MTQEATERILEDIRAILAGLPAQESLKRFLRHPAHRRPAAMKLFLERIEELRTENPSAALQLAETARKRTAKLPKYFGNEARRVRARAFMVSGGIFRTLAMIEDAEACYVLASYLLGSCNYPPSEEIELMGRWAFLKRDQRRFDLARYFAERGLKIARHEGSRSEIGRSLVHLGNTLIYEDPAQATPYLREALNTLDKDEEPRYYLAACQALGSSLCETAESDPCEVLKYAEMALDLSQSQVEHYQCLWLSGRALDKFGKHEVAIERLELARKGLQELGMATYAAAASLDLATLYLARGKTEKVRRIAQEVYVLFGAMKLGRETCASLALFKSAILRNDITRGTLMRLREFLIRESQTCSG